MSGPEIPIELHLIIWGVNTYNADSAASFINKTNLTGANSASIIDKALYLHPTETRIKIYAGFISPYGYVKGLNAELTSLIEKIKTNIQLCTRQNAVITNIENQNTFKP
jgi:hypothetical protein